MNAAALLVVAGKAKDEIEGVKMARESITKGRAMLALTQYRDCANKAMKEEDEEDTAQGR